jgi:hypothetical protein
MGRAITMLQPWASLTVLGFKTLETRTHAAVPGKLWIHASKSPRGITWLRQNGGPHHMAQLQEWVGLLEDLPKQQILGSVVISNTRPLSHLDAAQAKAFGFLIDANIVWEMEAAQVCEPFHIAGKPRIWRSDKLGD